MTVRPVEKRSAQTGNERLGTFRGLRASLASDKVQFDLFARDRATTTDNQMTTVPMSIPGSEYNDFLFAVIGEDKNGMLVSVLSGLARSNIDPWQEAAKLAQLPGDTATRELAALIGALPDRSTSYPDPRTIATRLISLLPHPLASDSGPQQAPQAASAAMKSRPWWIYLVFMCFVLGSQLLIESHQLPAKPAHVETKPGTITLPPTPPVSADQ
jgi:hypothetical protein